MVDAIDRVYGFGLVALSGVLGLLAVLWIFGTRPVSRLSPAELIVAVALGLVIGLAMLSPSLSGAEGVVAILGLTLVLCSIRLADRWRARSPAGFDAALVFHRSSFLPEALAKAGATEQTVIEAVRAHGYRTVGEISTVILKVDGTFTIVPHPEPESRPVLRVVSSNTSSDG